MYASEAKAKVQNISSSEKSVLVPLAKSKNIHHVKRTEKQALQATHAIHKGRTPRESPKTREFSALRNWAI